MIVVWSFTRLFALTEVLTCHTCLEVRKYIHQDAYPIHASSTQKCPAYFSYIFVTRASLQTYMKENSRRKDYLSKH